MGGGWSRGSLPPSWRRIFSVISVRVFIHSLKKKKKIVKILVTNSPWFFDSKILILQHGRRSVLFNEISTRPYSRLYARLENSYVNLHDYISPNTSRPKNPAFFIFEVRYVINIVHFSMLFAISYDISELNTFPEISKINLTKIPKLVYTIFQKYFPSLGMPSTTSLNATALVSKNKKSFAFRLWYTYRLVRFWSPSPAIRNFRAHCWRPVLSINDQRC